MRYFWQTQVRGRYCDALRTHVLRVAQTLRAQTDVWEDRRLELKAPERVRRHRYDVATTSWKTDDSLVKCEETPFDEGAMLGFRRRCFFVSRERSKGSRGVV